MGKPLLPQLWEMALEHSVELVVQPWKWSYEDDEEEEHKSNNSKEKKQWGCCFWAYY